MVYFKTSINLQIQHVMADYNTEISESDISVLKETLCAQQHLLQKLYNELDAEREASATAASEALSVILRLQGEKAAITMEAEQYKRLSEHKICHAEESLAIIHDMIHQKEMEIAALDHELQAYRYKLLSMGCNVDEPKNENLKGSFRGLGRIHSAPVSLKCKKVIMNERDGYGFGYVQENLEENNGRESYDRLSDSDKKSTDSSGINSYYDQIKELDARVKEIAGVEYTDSRSGTRSPSSLSSRTSGGDSCDTSNSTSLLKNVVHDVFEVPQVDEKLSSCKNVADRSYNVDHDHDDKPDWLKELLKSNHSEKTLHEKLRNVADIDCQVAVVHTQTSMSEPEHRLTSMSESEHRLNQTNRTDEIVEVEQPTRCSNRDEELKLLNEIKDKLNSLHNEIRRWKVKKSPKREEPSLDPLAEAMLYFWL